MNKFIAFIFMIFVSSMTFASTPLDITDNITFPEGLKDCKAYKVKYEQKIVDVNLYVIRCSGNDNVTTHKIGKYPLRTSIISDSVETNTIEINGKTYIRQDAVVDMTNVITVNGTKYIELK